MTALPDGWSAVRLRDAARWYSGGTPRTSTAAYWNGEIPWISAASMRTWYIQDSDRRITKLGSENGTRLVSKGTTLLVVRGMSLKTEFRMGVAARVLAFGQDCKALVAADGVLPAYLPYALAARTPQVLAMVDEAGHGTGRLATDRLGALTIWVPPVEEQRSIAQFLSLFDDRIQLNRDLVDACERLAVLVHEQHSTAPRRLSALVTVERTPIDPSALGGQVVSHYSLPAFDKDRRPERVEAARIMSGKFRVEAGRVLLSRLNPRIPRVWLPDIQPGDLALASTEFLVLAPREGLTAADVWAVASQPGFLARMASRVTGTSGSHQRVSPEDVLSLDVCDPRTCAPSAREWASELISRAALARAEMAALVAMRSELLSPLTTGELRVHEVDEVA